MPKKVIMKTNGKLLITPATQTVETGMLAEFTASNGRGDYAWSAPEGTPSAGTGSTFSVTFDLVGTKTVSVASAGRGKSATVTVILPTVAETCPSLTLSDLSATPLIDTVYSGVVTGVGGLAPYTFSLGSGSLPTGLSLAGDGAITGTPTVAQNVTFRIDILDANDCPGSRTYNVTIAAAPAGECPNISVLAASLPPGAVNVAYSQTLTQSGGTNPSTYAVTSGSLPTGLALSSGGALTGTPTVAGTYTFSVTVTDTNACVGSRGYAVLITPAPAPPPPPSSGQFEWDRDMEYLGYFKVPKTTNAGTTLAYNGMGLAYNPNSGRLFISSRKNDSVLTAGGMRIAEITIPALNGTAAFAQSFVEPTEGAWLDAQVAGTRLEIQSYVVLGTTLYGMHYAYYDGASVQSKSHWKRPVNLSTTGQFTGLYGLISNPAIPGGKNPTRFNCMGAIEIPTAWQADLGGKILTGGESPTVSGGASNGYAGFGWDVDAFAAGQETLPLLYYPQANPLDIWDEQSYIWNGTTVQAGGFIAGDSLVYVYHQGIGKFGYGLGTTDITLDGTQNANGVYLWYDPANPSKGDHAYPYVLRALAYDIPTLVANRATPWTARPYASWTFDVATPTPLNAVTGLAVDRVNKKVYLSQGMADGTYPIIHVFQGTW